jgi:hypothetical protein
LGESDIFKKRSVCFPRTSFQKAPAHFRTAGPASLRRSVDSMDVVWGTGPRLDGVSDAAGRENVTTTDDHKSGSDPFPRWT